MIRLPAHAITDAFRTVSLRGGTLPMGHVLNIDHFHMAQPTFPPHPHAGFSAVTWMMPWSRGGFVNRDSHGDRSRIGPGTLHWTVAGAGIVHEEIPEVPGTDCEGLQIFVKLPAAMEATPAAAFHVDADAVPRVDRDGSTVRVLVGSLADAVSPVPVHAGTTMLHASVRGPVVVDVPDGVDAFAMTLRGSGRVAGASVTAHVATPLAPGRVALDGPDLEVLLAWSEPLPARPVVQGPFCLFDPADLAAAVRRYREGAMGTLAPSLVTWHRPG